MAASVLKAAMNAGADGDGGALSDRMVELIRKAILRGLLQPGEHLSQTRLAEEYAVSKVPVREALKQLDAEGLLQHDRNRGYFVASVSRTEALQLYKLRRWLEQELLRSAHWPEKQELAEMRACFATVEKPLHGTDREQWMEALSHLRFQIFNLSPEKTLLREAMRLWTLTDRFRALLPADKSASAEGALLDALKKRDRDALLAAHDADRTRIETLVEEALENLPSYWRRD